MNTDLFDKALSRAQLAPISEADARTLACLPASRIPDLLTIAAARRDRLHGRVLTFSPKVFLPLTNLCRNRCDYCSFRKSPGDAGEWTMTPDEVRSVLEQGRAQGCCEALFCLGDTPETGYRPYYDLLRTFGHDRTVDYLEWAGALALEHDLLPHTNAGILMQEDMVRLRRVNVSLGLMLENVSERLCEKGMPHHKAPDKRPKKRIAMTRGAGELRIPFTSGLLIGIGETLDERVDTLLTIRAMHREFGHIQEVIVQNFRTRPEIPMALSKEPDELDMAHMVALTRLVLDDDVSVQAPPNLNPASIDTLIRAGIDDFGGISPVTPDFINPRHPWPHLESLERACKKLGFSLRPRLPLYDRHIDAEGFLDPSLRAPVEAARKRLGSVRSVTELSLSHAKPTSSTEATAP
jgi:7,8-didemethyl-8-hydroxy-5-deazariboflavin synthase CofG subunit